MRNLFCLVLIALMASGCFWRHSKTGGSGAQAGKTQRKMYVTPETTLVGKVVSVNENARFAVLNFPVGTMPSLGQQLNVYHRGLKVGEVKVSGPVQDDYVVVDITVGDAAAGDETRPN